MDSLSRAVQEWWLYLLQGVLGIVFGILALVWPGKTLGVVIVLFGLFALISGIVGVFAAIGAAGNHQPWGWKLASAALGILVGLVILKWPGVTALVLLFLVGIWAIVTGIVAIVGAFADHDAVPHAWLLVLAGAVSVLFGIAMLAWPAAGLLTLVYLVGIYAIVTGIIACVIAFRVRSLPQRIEARTKMPPGEAASY
jgi:uncharacterized membrane protein HdeD (DUF308 family)